MIDQQSLVSYLTDLIQQTESRKISYLVTVLILPHSAMSDTALEEIHKLETRIDTLNEILTWTTSHTDEP